MLSKVHNSIKLPVWRIILATTIKWRTRMEVKENGVMMKSMEILDQNPDTTPQTYTEP